VSQGVIKQKLLTWFVKVSTRGCVEHTMFAALYREMIPQHEITLGTVGWYGHGSLNDGKLSRLFIYTWNLIYKFLDFWKVPNLIVIIALVFTEPRIKFMKVVLLRGSETLLVFTKNLWIICPKKPEVWIVKNIIFLFVKQEIYQGIPHTHERSSGILKVQNIYG